VGWLVAAGAVFGACACALGANAEQVSISKPVSAAQAIILRGSARETCREVIQEVRDSGVDAA
jgi:hypothetical protein